MPAGRVKLANEKKCVRMDGSPSIVDVQPSFGRGQWSGYSPPTVHSVSIGPQRDDLCGVGGGEHTDRIASDECADVLAVLGFGVHLDPDEIEVGPVVEDRGDHLGAYRAGAPLDDSVRRARRRHTEARYRVFDNNSVTIDITIN